MPFHFNEHNFHKLEDCVEVSNLIFGHVLGKKKKEKEEEEEEEEEAHG